MNLHVSDQFRSLLPLLLSAVTLTALADDALTPPRILKYEPSDDGIFTAMSGNGEWALTGSAYSDTQCQQVLINVPTGEQITLDAEDISFSCVTDDGQVLVGQRGLNAIWYDRSSRQLHTLPNDPNWQSAAVNAITPDGHYAVGTFTGYVGPDTGASATYFGAAWCQAGAMWDLTADTLVTLPNLPELDMTHENQWQMRYTGISADGRYVVISQSYSYLEPPSLCCYVYDRETQSARAVGFDPDDVHAWSPWDSRLYFCDGLRLSPNGQWATGEAYVDTESQCFRYNLQTGDFELIVDDENPMSGYAIDNDGTVYGCAPGGTPLREVYVRYGQFWIGMSEILSQRYGMDFCTQTAYERTGTLFGVTGDGLHLQSMVYPYGESYVMTLAEPLSQSCLYLDLLAGYTVTPTTDSQIAQAKSFQVKFPRTIRLTDQAHSACAQLIDVTTGSTLRNSLTFEVEDDQKTLRLGFRTTTLTDGHQYEVFIPEGMVCCQGAPDATNREIRLAYTGRPNQPLQVISVSPADGSALQNLSYDYTPVILTFDAQVALTDSAAAYLYRTDQQNAICQLSVASSGNRVALYPASAQYLYDGLQYRVELAQGSVTDVAGGCANERLEVAYTGSYVREITTGDRYLFQDDFSSMSQSLLTYMLYEGDHLTPTSDMRSLGFDADNTPWNFSIRETTSSTDYCASSHSMYSPAGQSDDWMMIPQLFIPDETCLLNFDAQSYYGSRHDTLTLVVWESDASISALTDDVMRQVREDGRVLLEVEPGNGGTDEGLAGEWQHFQVSLAPYAGRNVYLAFVNRNRAQSAIFLDNISVERNVMYTLALSNADAVVAQEEATIQGRLTIQGDSIYRDVRLSLLVDDSANGRARFSDEVLDVIHRHDRQLQKGDTIDFCFRTPLPLTVGEETLFGIHVQIDDFEQTTSGSIKDLAFSPVKRVVLEEMTGITCVYCPQGIIAIEAMKELAGDRFIPLSLHTYTGDPYASGQDNYQSFLGLNAAPTGRLQRRETVYYPMSENEAGEFQLQDPVNHNLWMDILQEELAAETTHDLSVAATHDEAAQNLSVQVEVCSALHADNQLLNLFMVVLEDSIVSYQQNALYGVNQPILGEWSNGGQYASAYAYPFVHNDVVRACWGSSYSGTSGLLPQQMEAGSTYEALIETTVPGTVSQLAHCRVVVMLIDANTGLVVNAAQSPISAPSAITTARADSSAASPLYNLFGQKVAHARGMVIRDGRLVLQR